MPAMTDAEPTDSTPWWGPFALETGAGGEWQVGPSTLWIVRGSRDWRVVHRPSTAPAAADPLAERSGATVPMADDALQAVLADASDALATHRFSVRHTQAALALRPALADRPVVARPEHPLSVLPDEAVTLYLSTPLWIQVERAGSGRRLTELPSLRMSDTWFGASTQTGTLCYATRTAGRLHLDRLPRRLHRAVTPLKVRNRADEPLALERVQLPTPHLSLYGTPDDALWSDAVTMTHRTSGEGAQVQIQEGPPPDVAGAERLQDPREQSRQGLITSTFSAVGALFGP
jgi:hypothetical protein